MVDGKMTASILSAIVSMLFFLLLVPAAAKTDLRAYYKDDFILEDSRSFFQLKIRGNLHLDYRFYKAEERGAPHSFDIRRGRIDLQGRLHRWFTFRLQVELAGNPYVRNAWMDTRPFDWLHVRLGQMKVPFSSSWLTTDNNINFIERGTSTPLYPFFDRGVMIWGDLSVHNKLYSDNGTIRSLSTWISFYLTGENKNLTNFRWKTAKPNTSLGEG